MIKPIPICIKRGLRTLRISIFLKWYSYKIYVPTRIYWCISGLNIIDNMKQTDVNILLDIKHAWGCGRTNILLIGNENRHLYY